MDDFCVCVIRWSRCSMWPTHVPPTLAILMSSTLYFYNLCLFLEFWGTLPRVRQSTHTYVHIYSPQPVSIRSWWTNTPPWVGKSEFITLALRCDVGLSSNCPMLPDLIMHLSFPSSSHFPNKLLDFSLWLGVCLGGIHYKTVMKLRTVT